MRLVLALLLAAGGAGEARAQFLSECRDSRTYAAVTVASYHLDRPNNYRERHAGLGIERVCDTVRAMGGLVPENSNDDATVYAGAAWTPIAWRELRGGIFGGLFTGYSRPVVPAGGLFAAWDGRRYGTNLLFVPPYDEHEGVLILQLKRAF